MDRGPRSASPVPAVDPPAAPGGAQHQPGTLRYVRARITRPHNVCRAAPEHESVEQIVVVAAVLTAGSEKAAAHRIGLAHSTVKHHLANARSKVGAVTTAQLVWILAARLPEPDGMAPTDDQRPTP